jgi:translation initiation factor 5A
MSTSKTGKHGHAKVHLIATDVRISFLLPSNEFSPVPVAHRTDLRARSASASCLAQQIFTQKKLEDISPSTHNMESPIVTRTEFQLVNIDDGFLNLMDDDGNSKDDVKVPEDKLGKDIEEAFENGKEIVVTVVNALGEEMALAFKDVTKNVSRSCLPYSPASSPNAE